jgi:pilus assembly protein CpaE
MNAKGGSGATLLACNVAHMMAAAQNLKVALVDLDIQFASLPHYFDLQTRDGLLDALESADHLDAVALEGYVTRHESGLRLMSSASDNVALPSEVSIDHLEKLVDLMKQNYQQVVFDLPRQIDHLTSTVIERSDRIFVVLQQSLSHVRDATRLLGILSEELGIEDDRITLVVNRFSKNAPISVADLKKALHRDDFVQIPNDYRIVTESINAGAPLYVQNRNAAISRALLELGASVSGQIKAHRRGLLSRALAGIRGE